MQVKIGNDVILGCGETPIFLDNMIVCLQDRDYLTLNHVGTQM